MSTATIPARDGAERRHALPARNRVQLGRAWLGAAGIVAVLVSAWGGLVPFVGPVFGFSADGSGSWHWSLAHAVLALVPGAVGVVVGLFVIAEARGIAVGRGRFTLASAGTVLMVCGAWFAIGPLAWPVLASTGTYFVSGSHLTALEHELGYSIGPGLVLVFCGAFVAGWASRHAPKVTGLAAEPTADPNSSASDESVLSMVDAEVMTAR
jgi:hypothetical protein